jgi:FkbM family methyltransferase
MLPSTIMDLVSPDELVFDIGAHAGDKAIPFLQKGARLVCVEPQPQLAEHMRIRFSGNPSVTVVPKGVGRAPGTLNLDICTKSPVLSTFSTHWKAGRFSGYEWDEQVEVEITTMDELIALYGEPRYSKIDVEGFEREVVEGLSCRIGILSLEFTSEYISHTMQIVHRLVNLGYEEFNLALAEDPRFQLDQWVAWYDVVRILGNSTKDNAKLWGDLYAR